MPIKSKILSKWRSWKQISGFTRAKRTSADVWLLWFSIHKLFYIRFSEISLYLHRGKLVAWRLTQDRVKCSILKLKMWRSDLTEAAVVGLKLVTINSSKCLQRSGWRNVLPSMSRRLKSFSNHQYRPPVAIKLNANTLALKLAGEWLQEVVMSVEWLQTGIWCCTGNLGTGLVTSRLQWWPVNCMKNADLSVNTRQVFSRQLWNRHVWQKPDWRETWQKCVPMNLCFEALPVWSTNCMTKKLNKEQKFLSVYFLILLCLKSSLN